MGSGITESIIFPDPDNFPANSPWPIQPNVPLTFTIPNFYIPPTSTGTVQVQVRVDPSNPDIVPSQTREIIPSIIILQLQREMQTLRLRFFSILVELIKALIQLNLN